MVRAALFTMVGVLWCARSLQSFADPEFMEPETAADWFAVLGFSAALLALAAALPMLVRYTGGGKVVLRVSCVPAAGAALAGVSNLLEDGLQQGFAFWLFVAGSAIIAPGLVAFTVAVAAAARGRRRLLAAVPLVSLVGMLLFESGGGVLVLAAWLAAAAVAVHDAPRAEALAAPTAT
jgi:hypothetical protein